MKIIVTAGPTREPIDPVRFISNRSSGKMGYSIASVALRRGHKVVLVSGPVSLQPPPKVVLIKAVTAADMLAAVTEKIGWCDALIMSAAVSDWRPARFNKMKIKKNKMPDSLPLAQNPDILMTVAPKKGKRIFVGFAAETGNLRVEALRKLKHKNLDLIVANDISRPGAGFETDTNRVVLFSADGEQEALPFMSKQNVAERIIEWIEAKSRRQQSAGNSAVDERLNELSR